MIFKISMEILYTLIYLIPFSILRYYPFRKKLRVSVPVLISIYIILILFQILGFTYINWYLEIPRYDVIQVVYRLFWAAIFFCLSCAVIKEKFLKHFFEYLIMFCASSLTMEIGYFIELKFKGEFIAAYPYTVINIVTLLIIIIIFNPIMKFMDYIFQPFIERNDYYIWNIIWLIPTLAMIESAMFTLKIEDSISMKSLISRMIMMAIIGIVIYILDLSIRQASDNAVLKERLKLTDRQLTIQKQQYEAKSIQMEEVRKARHDLRHYLTLVQEYLDSGEKERLQNFLDEYKVKLPPDTVQAICGNKTVNLLLCHYIMKYREDNIEADIKVALKDNCGITDDDLMVLFGNLLENSLEACERMEEGEKVIRIRAGIIAGKIVIAIANSYNGQIIRKDNSYGSMKRRGDYGVGLSSINAIAKNYNGSVNIEADNEQFKVNIILAPNRK